MTAAPQALERHGGSPPDALSLRARPPASIAVFRALQLGDMLCAVPALRALRAAFPDARITLIGLPWASSFVSRFAKYIDDLLIFPGCPGLPEREPETDLLPRFFAEAKGRHFDLAIQLHGSGSLTNPLTLALGARTTAGFYPLGAACPDPHYFMCWPEQESATLTPGKQIAGRQVFAKPMPAKQIPEIHRYLRLMAFLGIEPQGDELEFPLFEADYRSLEESCDCLPEPGTYACIHPGARLPSRRWPAERFALVADQLTAQGVKIVLTGAAEESSLVAAVAKAMRAPALNLCAKTDLGALAVLVRRARLLICNDTGVSHIAAAIGTPVW